MSRNRGIDDILRDLDKRIEKIWNKPPPEIETLLEHRGPYRQSFTMVIYAYFETSALASTLWILRQNAKTSLQINTLATVTRSILDSHAISLETYGLTDTAELLRNSSTTLAQVKKSKEYFMIIERLVVYLNRLGMAGWLDLLIPWQDLSYAFEKTWRTGRRKLEASNTVER